MKVEPYARPPKPPLVAVMFPDGRVVDEYGSTVPDDGEQGVRIYVQADTVSILLEEGRGEALTWNSEPIRYRLDAHPDEHEWRDRRSDAYVVNLPLDERVTPGVLLRGLAMWRDWLASFGASPTGTIGSAAMSLLRARLERTLLTGQGKRPPLRQTRGGRIELGPAGRGRFDEPLEHFDMAAAYARELGQIRYGGVWVAVDADGWRDLPTISPVFVRASVKVPRTRYGPLPRGFRHHVHYAEMDAYRRMTYSDGSPWLYPVAREVAGIWEREELAGAEAVGAVVTPLAAWQHEAVWRPFAPWWDAIDAGRSLGSVAGQLAKMTGNALWGRFCLDPKAAGSRQIRGGDGTVRTLVPGFYPYPAHDLAEAVSGRVRARLYGAMVAAGERLRSAHTDGIWSTADAFPDGIPGWRRDREAVRLDLLEPMVLRYRPLGRRRDRVVFAGVAPRLQAETFARVWREWEEGGVAA